MKLYVYDHCPFCVRARMIFALRSVPMEIIFLPNDDEATPIGLVGVKLLPILQKPDGSYMGESLDIVRFIDEYAGGERLDEQVRPEVAAWLETVVPLANKLIQPRAIALGLPEFSTQTAIDYYTVKKEALVGGFEQNLVKTAEYLVNLHPLLAELEVLTKSTASLNNNLSFEDILVFPVLRNLTMVRGLVFPEKIDHYVQSMSKQAQVPLYWDSAI